MSWNYRIMVRDGSYSVYSVYYADDGRIKSWSADPMPLSGESVEDLAEEIERFRSALSRPVLNYETAEPRRGEPGVAGGSDDPLRER